MADDRIAIIGAGIGGLSAAIALSAEGFCVTVLERASRSGGKLREAEIDGRRIDCGPTVFTMRWVFDDLFAAAGAKFGDYVALRPLDILARHAWRETEPFDLFADSDQTADAVGASFGADEARRFRSFCAEARTIYQTLKTSFLAAPRPNPLTLSHRIGLHRPGALFGIRPFDTLWGSLSRHFRDPRLRQLFGRYATYNGSSPFLAPATLMLIAHVEQDGVWTIAGGMQRLAEGLEKLARQLGTQFRFGAEVHQIIIRRGRAAGVRLASGEQIDADAIVVNADSAALAGGLFGDDTRCAVKSVAQEDRSLSAVTWAMTAETHGFPLLRHNVFFSADYQREFDQLFKQSRLPEAPTVYVCAQDRGEMESESVSERLFMLVNAPPIGDARDFTPEEISKCQDQTQDFLKSCGLTVRPRAIAVTTPSDFHRLFPATGGALYGRASHGWRAAFRRPGSATAIPGLYLAGGSTHPGAGLPMVTMSGQLAAQRLVSDLASTRPFRRAAISGGISTESAAMDALRSP